MDKVENNFDIKVFLKQINNWHDSDSTGPLIYVFDRNPSNNIGCIHPLKFSLKLFKEKISLTKGGLFKVGSKKFCLIFNSAQEANEFVENKIQNINPN